MREKNAMKEKATVQDWIILILTTLLCLVIVDDLHQRELRAIKAKTCIFYVSDGRTTIQHRGTIE